MLNNHLKDCPFTSMSGQWTTVGKRGNKAKNAKNDKNDKNDKKAHNANEVKEKPTPANGVSCIINNPCKEDVPNKGVYLYATRVLKYLIANFGLHNRFVFEGNKSNEVLYYYHKQTGVYKPLVLAYIDSRRFLQRLFIDLCGAVNIREHFATYLETFRDLSKWASLGQDNCLRIKKVSEILGEKGRLLIKLEDGTYRKNITAKAKVDIFGDWKFILDGEVDTPVQPTRFDIVYDTENPNELNEYE
jgi:hypothetical protein